jgi:type IV secretory pathway VirB3-like protein
MENHSAAMIYLVKNILYRLIMNVFHAGGKTQTIQYVSFARIYITRAVKLLNISSRI